MRPYLVVVGGSAVISRRVWGKDGVRKLSGGGAVEENRLGQLPLSQSHQPL